MKFAHLYYTEVFVEPYRPPRPSPVTHHDDHCCQSKQTLCQSNQTTTTYSGRSVKTPNGTEATTSDEKLRWERVEIDGRVMRLSVWSDLSAAKTTSETLMTSI